MHTICISTKAINIVNTVRLLISSSPFSKDHPPNVEGWTYSYCQTDTSSYTLLEIAASLRCVA